jgi:hypothetical protein
MEAVAGLFEGSGAGAAGGASAGASAGGASSGLSSGLGAFQGFAAIASGLLSFGAARQQSDIEKFNARQSILEGQQKTNDLTDDLLDTLAKQRVALAGDGGDLSSATTQILGATLKRGDQVRKSTELDAALSAQAHRISARALMTAGETDLFSGFVKAAGAGALAIERSKQRG